MTATDKELRWIRYLLILIALPVLAMILRTLAGIFIPLVLAIFLSFLFAPLIDLLKRKRVHIIGVILIILLILILVFMLLSSLLFSAGTSIVTGLPRYQEKFTALMSNSYAWIEDLGQKLDVALEFVPAFDPRQMFSPGSFSVTRMVSDTMSGFINLVWNIFLTMVFLLFIVGGATSMESRLKKALGEDQQERNLATVSRVQAQIQKYLITKTLISLATAIVGAVLMLIFGVDFVLVCALLLFAFNFIPNIGSIIASGIPIIICLLEYGLGFRVVGFAIGITATQMLFGNIIEPKLQGDRLNLSPIMVLISLILWGWVWGIPGMFISVPLTSAINIILKEIDNKNIVSAIISSR